MPHSALRARKFIRTTARIEMAIADGFEIDVDAVGGRRFERRPDRIGL